MSPKWFSNNFNNTEKDTQGRSAKSYTFSMLTKNKNNNRNVEGSTLNFNKTSTPRY